jgi:hypothetical protein
MKFIPLCYMLWGIAVCAGVSAPRFSQVQERRPELIWAKSISPALTQSLHAYQQRQKLANGVAYGSVIRSLDISGKCPSDLEAWAKAHSCTRQDDVIRTPKDNQPFHDAQGKTIPLVSFLCPDGGVIRMKPDGDSSQPKRPEPDAVKAMRFYGVDRYANFSDEAFKVDNAGLAVPKWPKDLNTDLDGLRSDPKALSAYLDEWADDAHTDLKRCEPHSAH